MAKLLKEVSINELLEMRNSGMTNREISENLGVSYNYVYKLIGKQPKELTAMSYAERGKNATVIPTGHRTADRTTFDAPNAANFPEPEMPAACLMVQNSIVELVSADGRTYIVDRKDGTVELPPLTKLTIADLGSYIAELSAIHRKVSGAHGVPLEAW